MQRSVATKRNYKSQKAHFIIVPACSADRKKLPPTIIFKRKTTSKEAFLPSIAIHTNLKKATMPGGSKMLFKAMSF